MATVSRLLKSGWLASIVIAAGLGMAALTPIPARAQDDDLVRVIVDVADVIFRGGYPYYRYGDYRYDDRLIVVRDRYGRLVYYRQVPRSYYGNGYYSNYRSGPPYGKAHGYWKKHRPVNTSRRVTCDRYGRCVTRYYDPRYDRRYYDNRYYGYNGYRYDRYDGRYWDGYRWRYHDRDDDDDD
jgi:hypothetical protein